MWTASVPRRYGRLVMVREIIASDAPSLLMNLVDPIVAEYVSAPPPSLTAFQGFVQWSQQERAAGRGLCFAIVPDGLTDAAGIIQLRALDPDWFSAEWGFALGAAFWSTGVFTEAAHLVAEFAFTEMNVHRIEARSVEQNARGQAALQKLGAKPEASLAKAFRKNGRADRQLLWTLTESDWRQHSLLPERISVSEARARIARAVRQSAFVPAEDPAAAPVRAYPFFISGPKTPV